VPSCAFALGVGQLEVRSALNQLFAAELPLVVNNPAEVMGLTVRVPRQEDFDRLGIERQEFFSKLRFAVESPPGGRSVVRVTSLEPMRDPNFHLLVELVWPRGRLIREFPVQLDPELYANRRPPPPPPPAVMLPPPIAKAPSAEKPTAPPPPALPAAPPVSFEGASAYGPVARGETLAAIARRVRPSSTISLPKMMAILVAGNPAAFGNGNPNLLRSGVTLKVPTAQALGVQGVSPPTETIAVAPIAATAPAAVAPPTLESTAPAALTATGVQPPAPAVPAPVTTPPAQADVQPPTTAQPPEAVTPPVATTPAPAGLPQEIVPQAIAPVAEGTGTAGQAGSAVVQPPVASSAPTAQTPSATETAAPSQASAASPTQSVPSAAATPVAPPPAGAAPATPLQEAEASWMSNPIIWLALGLIALAIAALVLWPLLRRPVRSKSATIAEPNVFAPPESATQDTQPPPATNIDTQARDFRAERLEASAGIGAAAAAAWAASNPPSERTQTPKPIKELLKDFEGEPSSERLAPMMSQGRELLLETAPTSKPAEVRRPLDAFTEPATESFIKPDLASTPPPQTEFPSELRLDGLDFDLNELGLDKSTRSRTSDRPPLEMKPATPGGVKRPVNSPLLDLSISEPATEPPSLGVVDSGAKPGLKFEFSDVTQTLEKQSSGQDVLRLDEDLQSLGGGVAVLDADKTASGGMSQGIGMDVTDYVETKLDLASAYLDMGDKVGARGLLEEVLREGDAAQKERAEQLLKKLS
ncbi:MAG: FimV/HubP family polar landmark protein, partial [Candidatus Contendobacter sp.]